MVNVDQWDSSIYSSHSHSKNNLSTWKLKLEASRLAMSCLNVRLEFRYTCSWLVVWSTFTNGGAWGRKL